MKCSGAEFKRFYADTDAWPEGRYHDDTDIAVDGVLDDGSVDLLTIPDTAVVTFTCGYVMDPGKEEDVGSFVNHFKKWHRVQSHQFLAVEVPKDKLGAVKDWLKSQGCKTS